LLDVDILVKLHLFPGEVNLDVSIKALTPKLPTIEGLYLIRSFFTSIGVVGIRYDHWFVFVSNSTYSDNNT